MTQSTNIKLWGVRGSLPAPLSPQMVEKRIEDILNRFVDFGRYNSEGVQAFLSQIPHHSVGGFGGNTPCVEIQSGDQRLIIDGGSGIRPLGYELMRGDCGKGHGEVHILFTHVHWDHLIGLPFFTPLFIPGNKIHVYAVESDLAMVFQTLFKKPFFPVALQNLGASIEYHVLEPRKTVELQGFNVTPYQLDHPDPCWGYRIEKNGKVYSHCVDTECTRVTRQALGGDLPLYQGVDLMIFDAQYSLIETIEKVNWGHAAATLGLDIAMREGVKRIIFMHHDPASNDDKIASAETQTRRYYKSQLDAARRSGAELYEVEWSFGYEGMVISL